MATRPERDIEEMAKGWSKAMGFSKARLQRVHDLAEDQLDDAINAGHLVLENVCLFIHACVRHGQFRPPLNFWQVLHSEYGIIVYPSAFQEDINIPGLGIEVTFTEAYRGHIMMYGGTRTKYPPRCPFEFMQEPPPVYQEETPKMEA
ncbi:hypothetical protein FVEN_g2574 [Fusarium venenatum]|uniref:Uncharacterized protein n=1 Tax=Fusarium venenatum TaxID=56646 RepID=A0A2L2STU4_9HYPO|nr:uncharacterized protein FVRRES_05198 [Fusarium venenatum]KAG8359916.1 hypothetical protein FVEN_g2574 [Fusarium venenatum]KAH6992315.1 hypothetical protein EDB82DRAFT_138919 [Fusarium venenatum]CEI60762.1 unnamed protein product [Fusarium venenatum]